MPDIDLDADLSFGKGLNEIYSLQECRGDYLWGILEIVQSGDIGSMDIEKVNANKTEPIDIERDTYLIDNPDLISYLFVDSKCCFVLFI